MRKLQLSLVSLGIFSTLTASAQNWVDTQHHQVQETLHSWSNNLNDWLGETDPNQPASASLRIMLDNEWNHYDKFSFKPRVKGKIRLPILKEKLSVVFGDEHLDNENYNNNRTEKIYRTPPENNKRYDRRQTRDDNSSIALRWSDKVKTLGIKTDLDVGLRATSDGYVRFTANRLWEINNQLHLNLEQIYRYGLRSRHYLKTNFETRYYESERIMSVNHLHYTYSHKHRDLTAWGNSLYRQHLFSNYKRLNYGVFIGGSFDANKHKINSFGPFINWRQPILRQWLFINPELHYYNNRDNERTHHIGAFLRIEAIF